MVPATLVHHTGTMIRFRPRQLPNLPSASRDVTLLLPNGELVDGHFNRHPQNPNVTGAGVVRYVKHRVVRGGLEDVLLEQRRTDLWIVHPLNESVAAAGSARVGAHVRQGNLAQQDLASLLALADRENDRGRRMATYKRVLRPSGLRRLMLSLVGAQCMVQTCKACERFDVDWGAGTGDLIVEVHHVEHVARTIDHYPRNLCVLCANHHRFVHGAGEWAVRHSGADVIFERGNMEMLLARPPGLFS
jgi:hypothetical protein